MCKRRRVAPAAHARPVVRVGPMAGALQRCCFVQCGAAPEWPVYGPQSLLGPAADGASLSMRLSAGHAETTMA
jgi:hypothetical protein